MACAAWSTAAMDSKKPYLAAVTIQLLYTGLFITSKAAYDSGMSTFIFVFYRQAFATALLLPLTLILQRKKSVPPMPAVLFAKVFLLTLLGITISMNLYGIGVSFTSATVASATTNSLPVITFLFALLLRMEVVRLKSVAGVAKIAGVALCLAGVLVIAFYLGPPISPLNHHRLFRSHRTSPAAAGRETWIKGTFLMLSSNTAWSLYLVLQASLLKDYPSSLLLAVLQCIISTGQSFLVALLFERDFSRWKPCFNLGLLAVTYAGFVVTPVTFYLQNWCIEKKGPVFLAMASPLALIFTLLCSFLVLGETIHFGSVLGGFLLVIGLYHVLWGKSKEAHSVAEPPPKERLPGEV